MAEWSMFAQHSAVISHLITEALVTRRCATLGYEAVEKNKVRQSKRLRMRPQIQGSEVEAPGTSDFLDLGI